MGKSYSLDIRERVVVRIESGQSCRASARHFGVGDSTAIRLMQRRRRMGTVAPPRPGRPPGNGKLAPFRAFLVRQVEASLDITMPELSARLLENHGVAVPASSPSHFLIKEGFTYKKALMASERARTKVKAEREVWMAKRQPRMKLEPHRLVFIDDPKGSAEQQNLHKHEDGPSARPFPVRAAAQHGRAFRSLGHADLHRRPQMLQADRAMDH
jgi:transposase